jgi:hypothetical protein
MANEMSDQELLAAPPQDQHAYLMANDEGYSKASKEDQQAYLHHLTSQWAPSVQRPAAPVKPVEGPIARGLTAFETGAVAPMPFPTEVLGPGMPAAMAEVTPAMIQHFIGSPAQRFREGDWAGATGEVMGKMLPFIGAGKEAVGEEGLAAAARVPKTAGRFFEEFSTVKPFRAFMKIPELWESTGPEQSLLRSTETASRAGKAAKIPLVGPRSMGAQAGEVETVMGPKGPVKVPSAGVYPAERGPIVPGSKPGDWWEMPRAKAEQAAQAGRTGAAMERARQTGRPTLFYTEGVGEGPREVVRFGEPERPAAMSPPTGQPPTVRPPEGESEMEFERRRVIGVSPTGVERRQAFGPRAGYRPQAPASPEEEERIQELMMAKKK